MGVQRDVRIGAISRDAHFAENNMEKNGNVKMPIFILVITLFVTILGVIWNTLSKVRDDTVEIKVNAKETRTMLDILISRINRGEVTIKNTLREKEMRREKNTLNCVNVGSDYIDCTDNPYPEEPGVESNSR